MDIEPKKTYNAATNRNRARAQIIAVTSGKGGVGKTSITVNLALTLAKQGHKVCVFDADTGLANINILLNLRPELTIEHVLQGDKNLEDITVDGPLGIRVIPGATGISEYADLEPRFQNQLIKALISIENQFDFVLIDTPAGIGSNVIHFTQAAQRAAVVITPEPTSLTDSFSLIKVLKRQQYDRRIQVIANMCSDAEQARQVFSRLSSAAKKYLDVELDYLGMIPHSLSMRAAVKRQQPVTLNTRQDAIGQAFSKVTDNLCRPWPGLDTSHSFSDYWEKLSAASGDSPSHTKRPAAANKRSVSIDAPSGAQAPQKSHPKIALQSETSTRIVSKTRPASSTAAKPGGDEEKAVPETKKIRLAENKRSETLATQAQDRAHDQAPITDMLADFSRVQDATTIEDVLALLERQSWDDKQLQMLISRATELYTKQSGKNTFAAVKSAKITTIEPNACDSAPNPDDLANNATHAAGQSQLSAAEGNKRSGTSLWAAPHRKVSKHKQGLTHDTYSARPFAAQDILLSKLQSRDPSQPVDQFLQNFINLNRE